MLEPRCLVCGAPLSKGAPFEKTVRESEVCSDECYEIYMYNEDEEPEDSANALNEDADREMIGDDVDFGLENIGCK